jgi:hypothetical protein
MDDDMFQLKLIDEILVLRPDVLENGLALHARKEGKNWNVWYERNFDMIGNIF